MEATNWCGLKRTKTLAAMDKNKILVFDVETTGLHHNDEILQITLLDGNGTVLFDSYIRPEHRKTWSSAEKVHHISPSMVRDAPTLNDVRPRLQELFDEASVVVGYNLANFDIPFVERHGIAVTGKVFDVMKEFKQLKHLTGEDGRNRLTDCAEYFGVSFSPHDSKEDALATLICFNHLIADDRFNSYAAKSSKGEPGAQPTDKLSAGTSRRERRTPSPVLRHLPHVLPFVCGIALIGIAELVARLAGGQFIASIGGVLEVCRTSIGRLPAMTWELAASALALVGIVLALVPIVRFVISSARHVVRSIGRLRRRVSR